MMNILEFQFSFHRTVNQSHRVNSNQSSLLRPAKKKAQEDMRTSSKVQLHHIHNMQTRCCAKSKKMNQNLGITFQLPSSDLPLILQRSLNVGVSPPQVFTPWLYAVGTGMVTVMGLWNFLRRGSIVTMGLTITLFPRTFLTTSLLTGWAQEWNQNNDRF